ncbi:MAG: Gldg family protein, partial [Myxococcota bacterium]
MAKKKNSPPRKRDDSSGVDARAQEPSRAVTGGRLAGTVAAVLVFTTPFTWWLSGEAGPFVWGKLLLATLAIAFYFATNSDSLARLAGNRSNSLLLLSAGSVLVAAAFVVLVNFFAWQNPREFDVTGDAIFTLSDKTRKVLERLDADVELYGFVASTEPNFATVKDALERYGKSSERVSVQMVNPESRPDLVEKFAVTEAGPRIVVRAGAREAKARNSGEQELTNAIVKVAERIEKTVGFLSGHGELDIDDSRNAEGA